MNLQLIDSPEPDRATPKTQGASGGQAVEIKAGTGAEATVIPFHLYEKINLSSRFSNL